jgi:hypothetical protein
MWPPPPLPALFSCYHFLSDKRGVNPSQINPYTYKGKVFSSYKWERVRCHPESRDGWFPRAMPVMVSTHIIGPPIPPILHILILDTLGCSTGTYLSILMALSLLEYSRCSDETAFILLDRCLKLFCVKFKTPLMNCYISLISLRLWLLGSC